MIGGKQKENVNYVEQPKYTGLFECKVIMINPFIEEFKETTGWSVKPDSKQFEYLSTSDEGNAKLRVDVWLEEVKKRTNSSGEQFNAKFKVSFFLENKEKENKDATRKQYINNVGVTSWADDPNKLLDWFTARDYRVAYVGEDQLYTFLKAWLNKLDYRDQETVMQLEWKKLMKGNVDEMRRQINSDYSGTFVALATIDTNDDGEEVKAYQRVYNSDFLLPYTLSNFRLVNYDDPSTLMKLRAKKDLKAHEKFVNNVTDPEYGCKDFYILKEMKEYNVDMNMAASNKVVSEEDADY